MKPVKNMVLLLLILAAFALTDCKKDEVDRFELLTGPVWITDSLLANGVDAGNPGQLLYKFKGNARFNKDFTGTFGKYTGTWKFLENETQILIKSDSLALPLTSNIVELTEESFKITTAVPDLTGQTAMIKIRMTFVTL
jgi:hypothetical protein